MAAWRVRGTGQFGGVEAVAVVGDVQDDRVVEESQGKGGVVRGGVFTDVGQGALGDAQQDGLDPVGQLGKAVVVDVDTYGELRLGLPCRQGAQRLSHPDGPAPYFSVYAPGRWGSIVGQWDHIKAAVSEAIAQSGGTITHHHAVGRDHRPWYDRQRPAPFAAALTAAKSALDPAGVLNPGVLLPTR